uniref:TOG domain-containing protein n=1 Tax=Onchocerca volvulus TaxID=6282 RepID=A0A8R1U018_ONCVO
MEAIAESLNNDPQNSLDHLKVVGRKYLESLNNSSSRQHQIAAQSLSSSLSNIAEIPDQIRKPLIRITVSTCFTRLTDRLSQSSVYLVISSLVRENPVTSMKHLAEAYTSFFERYTTSARWLTANSVLAVKWLFDLRNLIDLRDADIFSSYMSALLSVMSHICASKKFVKIQNKMKAIFNHDLLKKALEWIRNHYIIQSSSTVNILALLTLLPYSSEHFDFSFFVKIYIANILLAKHRPNIHVVVASSKIFKHISLEMFRDEIMAVVKKSMLRSPEIAIFGILYLLESTTVDLSSFAIDFYKILSASLISSIDEVRKHALLSVAMIAKKINDPKALKGLVDGVFGTYSGSDGRIATVGQRITVLQTLKSMSCHGVKDKTECDIIASDILQRLNSLLISEVHQTTLETMWKVVLAWSTQIINVDEKLQPVFMACLKSPNRSVTLRSMVNLYGIGNGKKIKLSDDLLKSVSDAYKTRSNAGDLVIMSLLLLTDEKAQENIRQTLESDFFKEKFISSLNTSDILYAAKLSDWMIRNTEAKNWSDMRNVFYVLFASLFWPDYEIRKGANDIVRKCVVEKGNAFCVAFLDCLFLCVTSGLAQEICKRMAITQDEENERILDNKLIAAALHEVMIPFNAAEENFDLGIGILTSGLLMSCSFPLVKSDPHCWNRWVRSIINVECLLCERGVRMMMNRIVSVNDMVIQYNAVKMLMSNSGMTQHIRGTIWEYCTDLLIEIDIERYVSITNREIAIYNTPDGVLYNTAVLELSYEEEFGIKNVKRENKLYKYKEQILEAQLKKELAEKRRQEGKLIPQQEEAKRKELLVEQKIREELHDLYLKCKGRTELLIAAVTGDPVGSAKYIHLLITIVIPLLRSSLVSSLAYNVFRSFCNAAFEPSEDYLHELILHSSVRVLRSIYTNTAWNQEPLTIQVERTIALLATRCVLVPILDDDEPNVELDVDDDETMNLIKFNVSFPMINAILRDESFPYALRLNTMRLLFSTLKGKFIEDNELKYLPLDWLCSLLLHILAADTSELYHIAKTLLQIFCELLDKCPGKSLQQAAIFKTIILCLLDENAQLRECALMALNRPHAFYKNLELTQDGKQFLAMFTSHIFIARNDPVEKCVDLANKIWQDKKLSTTSDLFENILSYVTSEHMFLRKSSSVSLGKLLREFPEILQPALDKLDLLYSDYRKIRPPVYDDIGRVVVDPVDLWKNRAGIAEALFVIAPDLPHQLVMNFIRIVVPNGISDSAPECRELMQNAAVEAIRMHGEIEMTSLLPFLEEMLSSTPDGKEFDNLRQGLVIMLGTLAQHLDPANEKVRVITSRLIETLSTPSQQVQEAVSKCLPALVPAIKDRAKELVSTLSCLLIEADSYGERRGAAYGIAGLVKGLGMSAMRELELIKFLQNSLANKKNVRHREGALLALELLCSSMGKLFEPYIVQLLPSLLICFGDSDDNVRQAANDAAQSMMSMLSAHGVKLVLPSLLAALDEDSWRTKCASVELLGSMAFCAPKQLSACLPSIVPKLIEVLTDSHSKVQKSGEKALKQIAKVIRNPEILSISNQLLTGLTDPADKTSSCLQTVVNTKFIHYIDAASLSLIMPIVRRAFTDRASETRRMAAQIIANIYSLADNKDMEPYLAGLLPGLQKSLLDPIPEIRTVAAKALGAIIGYSTGDTASKMREQLIPWLKEKLVSNTNAVDRSGAAQGLAEVLKAVGEDQLAMVMPDIIKTTESKEATPEIRDGYILMYIYLPMAFGDHFVPYLPEVIPSILKALADENEYVRDSALKAGQRLIVTYCVHARRLLLPQLQAALFDYNWRIRFAAVTLIGDFLFSISGVSGKMTSATLNEDDTMGMESAGKAIVRQLGQTCRDRVLAGIYLLRSDIALQVRQVASHVWKIVVANTPRTLKELMKTLFEMLLGCLASNNEDRQMMAGRCLGELVKKMGERIIIDVLPVLERSLLSESIEQHVGVAIALHEIIENSTKDIVLMYSAQLVEPIKKIICDSNLLVRQAAATAFVSFYQTAGFSAFEDIVAPLLDANVICNDNVLDGLSQIMRLNGRQMLPYVLPKLTRAPVNIRALCALSAVAGDSLSRNIARILGSMLDNCTTDEEINQCLEVILSVSDEDGILITITTLLQRAQSCNHIPSSTLIRLFAKNAKVIFPGFEIAERICSTNDELFDLSNFVDEILPGTLLLYNSAVNEVVENAVETLIYVCQSLDQKQMLFVLSTLKQALLSLQKTAGISTIPGFACNKGLASLLPIIREAILSGSAELKEQAAETLGTIVLLSTADALKPYVVSVTGPLIRVLGDRYPHTVKISILTTLSLLMDKIDVQLRPFLPQLQSTFLKALQDTAARKVRLCAGGALSRLISIHTKPDLIVLELIKYLNTSVDATMIETTLIALRAILVRIQSKVVNDSVLQEAIKVAEKHQENNESMIVVQAASALLGELTLKMNQMTNTLISISDESCRRYAVIVTFQYICYADPHQVLKVYDIEKLRSALISSIQCDKPEIASSALRAATSLLLCQEAMDVPLLSSVVRAINHPDNEVKCVVALGIHHIASRKLSINEMKIIVPMMLNGIKERNSAVRAACEQALIALFKLRLRNETTRYDDYLSTVEGAARDVLTDAYKTLQRVLKQPDPGLEPLSDIINVP